MAKFNLYKLHFTTPVHLGDNREDYGLSLETIQSDTLHAAIIACLAKLGIAIPQDGDLGCSISSLFPFYQANADSEAVLFFPKPLNQKLPSIEKVSEVKKIKKIAWLDTQYFEQVLNGVPIFENNEIEAHIHGKYLTKKDINPFFISSEVSPRVTISRIGDEDAVPFYMDRIYFNDYSGLYFLAVGDTELLDKGLSLLQYEGIGTDRNVGNGYFHFDNSETIELKTPDNTDTAMSLSVFIPEEKIQTMQMINGKNVAYDFSRRGGWITTSPYNTIRKNVIYAFTPASIFSLKVTESTSLGKIVDLNPKLNFENLPKIEHPIWRNGKSIFIPIKT